MYQLGKNVFQALGEVGDFLVSDLLTSPIRRLINRDAMRAGIDFHNPHRSAASLLSSCGMGTALGFVLGPAGGIFGGLLGYVIAVGSSYEGDQTENVNDSEEVAQYILEFKAIEITVGFQFSRQIAEASPDLKAVPDDVQTKDGSPAARGKDEVKQRTDGGGLAGAVGTEIAEHLAALNIQIYIKDTALLTVELGQPLYVNNAVIFCH